MREERETATEDCADRRSYRDGSLGSETQMRKDDRGHRSDCGAGYEG